MDARLYVVHGSHPCGHGRGARWASGELALRLFPQAAGRMPAGALAV